ncbi:gins complex subunit [Malassezia pachydermatis]|uniref:DNA replication complex GINS protein PSF3 n=1 Tax=Malassezia pachydermatis TaxID=77020 RepID=A0A0M9VPQ8_9BASI|nr:gins complex subunit [Malassezia pachydermatis]KOS14532.1 gins complex subunit [Malassezia pachydermatis]
MYFGPDRSDIVTIQQPRAFGSRVRSALDASAAAVRLRDLLPYWYALALRLASLLDSDSMRDWLSKTYMGRLPRIYELSVLLGRTTSVTESATTGRIQDTSHLSSEMQEFMQGLEEGETTCTFMLTET